MLTRCTVEHWLMLVGVACRANVVSEQASLHSIYLACAWKHVVEP